MLCLTVAFIAGAITGPQGNASAATSAAPTPTAGAASEVSSPDSSGAVVEEDSGVDYPYGAEIVRSASGFIHPGVYVDLPTLEVVRQRVAGGEEPWASLFRSVRDSSVVDATIDWSLYADAADPMQACDPESKQGCVLDCDEYACRDALRQEVNSAYGNALLWYYSGDERYAKRAISTLNGFSKTLRGFTSYQAPAQTGTLMAGWLAQTLVRAAEIIRYTHLPGQGEATGLSSQSRFDVGGFETFLRRVALPMLSGDRLEGRKVVNNWRASAIEATIGSAVFLDDRNLYNRAVAMWRELVPSYIYLSRDGSRPQDFPDGLYHGEIAQACYWSHGYGDSCVGGVQSYPDGFAYQNGQSAEACRDYWHAGAGLGGIINTAQTASLQGTDLFGEERDRLLSGVSYLLQIKLDFSAEGYPSGFCGDAAEAGEARFGGDVLPEQPGPIRTLSDVVAYNHYVTASGLAFPRLALPGTSSVRGDADPVEAYVEQYQSGPSDTSDFVTAWQSLTFYGVGDARKTLRDLAAEGDSPAPTRTAPVSATGRSGDDAFEVWAVVVAGAAAAAVGAVIWSAVIIARHRRGRR